MRGQQDLILLGRSNCPLGWALCRCCLVQCGSTGRASQRSQWELDLSWLFKLLKANPPKKILCCSLGPGRLPSLCAPLLRGCPSLGRTACRDGVCECSASSASARPGAVRRGGTTRHSLGSEGARQRPRTGP